MEQKKRVTMVLAVLMGTVIFDQLTKWIAVQWLAGRRPIVFLGDVFRFEYAENPGAILSLGGGLSPQARFWIFTVLVAVLLGFMLFAALGRFRLDRMEVLALAIICGGGFSNLGDRVFNEGRVIDFMNMGIGGLRTGVFNVADVAIIGGAILLLARGVLTRRSRNAR